MDLSAPTGAGVDAIHVWAFPTDGSPARFVDQATLGGGRLDVGAVFGSQFNNAGYDFLMTGLAPGVYDIGVYARSTVTGTFNQQRFTRVTIVGPSSTPTAAASDVGAPATPLSPLIDSTVASAMEMVVDVPRVGPLATGPLVVAGWALDRDAVTDTGIGGVHVWAVRREVSASADPVQNDQGQPPVFLGAAASGVSRPDVGAVYGAQFDQAGWQLVAPALAPGEYDLLVYAWNLRTGQFEVVRVVRVVVQ